MRTVIEDWRDGLGLAGLLIAAALSWLGPAGFHVGLALLLIAFAADWRAWRGALRDPLFLALLAALGWLLLRWLIARLEGGIPAADQLKGLRDWGMLLLFPAFAWWLRGDPERVQLVWLTALVGMLTGLLGSLDAETLGAIAGGERYGFHLKKPIALALYVAALALGLLLLAPRCWGAPDERRRWLRIPLWAVALLLLMGAFLAAQSRGALLALVVAWPPVLLLRYRRALAHWQGWLAVALIGGILLFAAGDQVERFRDRLTAEPEAIEALTEGRLSDAPRSDIGIRLRLWAFGYEAWRGRPWIGWGPGATEALIAGSGDPRLEKTAGVPYDHLHNSYLELLVRFGLIGALVGAVLIALLLRAIWHAWRQGTLPEDHALWLVGTLAFTAVWCLTDFRSQHHDWRFFWLLLAGSAYAATLRRAAAQGR